MRRRAIGVLVLLLLGMITSVLVAWGCVYRGFSKTNPIGWGEHRENGLAWGFTSFEGTGLQIVQLNQRPEHQLIEIDRLDEVKVMSLDSWVNPQPSPLQQFSFSQYVAAGWPMQSITCRTHVLNRDGSGWTSPDVWQGAIFIPNPRLIWAGTPLPLWPRLGGSLINVLLYALVWWILWRVARAAWWATASSINWVAPFISPSPSNPICPRCGYDQRGVIAQWQEACPLRGVCSECGLNFGWSELLNPNIYLPTWCIERSCGVLRLPLQFLGTCFRTCWPWTFWRTIRMSHDLHPKRLALFLLIHLGLVYFVFAAAHGWIAWDYWQRNVKDGYVPTTGGWPVAVQGALTPWSEASLGSFAARPGSWSPGSISYLTPAELFDHVWNDFLPPMVWVVVVHCCTGLAFAALLIFRRRYSFRWRHVLRLTVYGFGIYVIPIILSIAAIAMNKTAAPAADLLFVLAITGWALVLPLVLTWWSIGASRYLHMPHGWAVGIAVMVMGALQALVPAAIYVYLTSPL